MFNYYKVFILPALLCLLFSSPVFGFDILGDQDGKINVTDAAGKKQGKWIYFGKDRPESGVPANGKVEEGKYLDDRKEGIWIKYHKDGVTPALKGNYSNNRPMGQYTRYWDSGLVKEKGTFEKNVYKDSLVRYHENGKVAFQGIYNNEGKESGKIKYYYPNGQLEYEYTSTNGVLTGKATRYYENGDIKEISTYDAGGNQTKTETREPVKAMVKVEDPSASKEKAPVVGTPKTQGVKWAPNGYNKLYNKDGEIWQDGTFKNGVLFDGKVYVYDSDGILLKVKVYKNGVYHSDGQL
jgi:antitoxin component YwqK of YwqJK toxin-antitoxin module